MHRFGRPAAAAFVMLTVAAGGAASAEANPPAPPESLNRVCAYTQLATAGLDATRPPVDNVVHSGYSTFVGAKSGIEPLRTHQYVEYEDGSPVQIRCKGRSGDLVAERYGTGPAEEGSCADVNRTTLKLVAASLTAAERGRAAFDPDEVVLDPDTVVTTGAQWTADFPSTAVDGGVLHLRANAMLIEWNDPKYQSLPIDLRGVHYCTLVAAPHLKDVLLGDAPAG